LDKKNCYNCRFFYRRPGVKNYFIYKCSYWGIVSKNILPQIVVMQSIGKKCPFFKMKNNNKKDNKKNNDDNKINKDDDDLDIII